MEKQENTQEEKERVEEAYDKIPNGLTYGELTKEQLSVMIRYKEIVMLPLFKPSKWDIKDLEEAQRDIKRQKEYIAEKKEQYERSIKDNKERIKQLNKIKKKKEKGIKESEERVIKQQENINILKNINKEK